MAEPEEQEPGPLRARLSDLGAAVDRERQAYSGSREGAPPLGGYLTLLGAYGTAVTAGMALVRRHGVKLPQRFSGKDLALMTVATHKVARLLTKDPVTSPIRAPLTRFEGPSGEGEIAESVRGAGLRHALGELFTCPFCIAQWVVTGLAFGMVISPELTRFVTSIFVMLTGSDLLQIAYAKAQASLD